MQTDSIVSTQDSSVTDQSTVFRLQMRQLAPLAAKVVSDILNDPKSSNSVRLRAALAVLKIASTPEPAARLSKSVAPAPRPETPKVHVMNPMAAPPKTEIPAQSCTMTVRKAPDPGRNSQCPCGSGLKYKRCCANLPHNPGLKPVEISANPAPPDSEVA